MGTVWSTSGWTIASVFEDHDEGEPREWHLVAQPDGTRNWYTTSQLSRLLREHGLDIFHLTRVPPHAHAAQPNAVADHAAGLLRRAA